MTDIEQKALALVNEVERQEGLSDLTPRIMRGLVMDEALCRAIEQHEAFAQEVSDAVLSFWKYTDAVPGHFKRFIIAKPDPLIEAFGHDLATDIRAAIEKRGGKIVWGEG